MKKILPWLLIFLTACSVLSTPAVQPSPTLVIPTATVATSTPEPYQEYTIEALRQRRYGGGQIEVLETLLETETFTSYSIRYPSDGLTIYGFVNVPKGEGPFPVIVSVHAYSMYGGYDVFSPYNDFADFFAAHGFVVLHPGLRNHPPSDNGDNLLRVGMSVDVLNLIALVKEADAWPAALPAINPDALGLWGMSLGGEIALRVLTINSDIKATVLYSSLNGDIENNSKHLYNVLQDEQFQQDSQVPSEMFPRISPMYYYPDITSPIQLHHGTADTIILPEWAKETCASLTAAGVSIECIAYEGAEHVFNRSNFEVLQQNALEFYQTYLK